MYGVRREDLPLPTDDELLVSEVFLGRCMHRHTTTLESRHGFGWDSSCSTCGDSIHLDDRPTPEEVALEWLRRQPRPATFPESSAQLGYKMEALGCRIQFLGFNGQLVCEVERDGRKFRSASHHGKPPALVEAAAKLARLMYLDASPLRAVAFSCIVPPQRLSEYAPGSPIHDGGGGVGKAR